MNKYFYLSCVLFFVILLIYNLKGEQISIEGGYRSPIYRPKKELEKQELEKKENNNITYITIFFNLILGYLFILSMKNEQQPIHIRDMTSDDTDFNRFRHGQVRGDFQ